MRSFACLPNEILLAILTFIPPTAAASQVLHPRTYTNISPTPFSTSPPYPQGSDGTSNTTSPTFSASASGIRPDTTAPGCPQIASQYGYTNLDLPTSGTGHDYAYTCNLQTKRYSSASHLWYQHITTEGDKTSSTFTTVSPVGTGSAPYTTLCDGFARAHGTPTQTGSTTFWTSSYDTVFSQIGTPPISSQCSTDGHKPTFPFSAPSCTIQSDDCNSLLTSFLATATNPGELYYATDAPRCDGGDGPMQQSVYQHAPRSACTLSGHHVDLYFWPQKLGNTDCPDSRRTITAPPDPAQTVTAVINGRTITSPDVLLSLDYMVAIYANALDSPNHRKIHGKSYAQDELVPTDTAKAYTPSILNFTNVQLTVPPQSLSTFVSYVPGQYWKDTVSSVFAPDFNFKNFSLSQSAEQYDFGNVQAPVAAKAYFLGRPDLYNLISEKWRHNTIFSDYHPILSAPQQLRDIDSRLSACSVDIQGIYDPPIALTPHANIVLPTLTSPGALSTSTAAQPGKNAPDQPAPTPFQGGDGSPKPSAGGGKGSNGVANTGPNGGAEGGSDGDQSNDGAFGNNYSDSGALGKSSGSGSGGSQGSGDATSLTRGHSGSIAPVGGSGSDSNQQPDQTPFEAPALVPVSSSTGAQTGCHTCPPSGGGSAPRAVVIDGKTLSSGGAPVLLSGKTAKAGVALNSKGNLIIDGTRTEAATAGPVTMGGSTYQVRIAGVSEGSDEATGSSKTSQVSGSVTGTPSGKESAGAPSQMPFDAGSVNTQGSSLPAITTQGSASAAVSTASEASGRSSGSGGSQMAQPVNTGSQKSSAAAVLDTGQPLLALAALLVVQIVFGLI